MRRGDKMAARVGSEVTMFVPAYEAPWLQGRFDHAVHRIPASTLDYVDDFPAVAAMPIARFSGRFGFCFETACFGFCTGLLFCATAAFFAALAFFLGSLGLGSSGAELWPMSRPKISARSPPRTLLAAGACL